MQAFAALIRYVSDSAPNVRRKRGTLMSEAEKQQSAQAEENAEKKAAFRIFNTRRLDQENDEEQDGKKKKKKKSWQREVLEWVVTLVVALVIAFVVRSFLFEPVYVDGNSMYPTLRHGEIMYVSKTSYGTGFLGIPFTDIGWRFNVGGNPERFDVVVCHYDGKDGGKQYNVVKRVVGLPGDTLTLANGNLIVTDEDGRPVHVDEDFIYHKAIADFGPFTVAKAGDIAYLNGGSVLQVVSDEDLASGNVVIVRDGQYYTVDDQPIAANALPAGAIFCTRCEEDQYFLMGDNRSGSLDSRDPSKGTVKRSEIVGKVEAVIWHTIPNRLDDRFGLGSSKRP